MNLARMVDCLDADLCDHIVNTSWEYQKAKVLISGKRFPSESRSNFVAALTGGLEKVVRNQILQALLNWSKQIKSDYPSEIVQCLYLPGITPCFETWCEGVTILKYEQGQEYKWHTDQTEEHDCDTSSRRISVVVYLNDDFKGGETEMIDRKYKPQKGKALVFPSNWTYPHRACPVEEGTKYALVAWFHSGKKSDSEKKAKERIRHKHCLLDVGY